MVLDEKEPVICDCDDPEVCDGCRDRDECESWQAAEEDFGPVHDDNICTGCESDGAECASCPWRSA